MMPHSLAFFLEIWHRFHTVFFVGAGEWPVEKVLKERELQMLKLLTGHISRVGPRTQASDLNLETWVEPVASRYQLFCLCRNKKRLMQKFLTWG